MSAKKEQHYSSLEEAPEHLQSSPAFREACRLLGSQIEARNAEDNRVIKVTIETVEAFRELLEKGSYWKKFTARPRKSGQWHMVQVQGGGLRPSVVVEPARSSIVTIKTVSPTEGGKSVPVETWLSEVGGFGMEEAREMLKLADGEPAYGASEYLRIQERDKASTPFSLQQNEKAGNSIGILSREKMRKSADSNS